ncbi:hypothetical protein EV182_002397 [Spiromyces aspiralis]|uniref:Uncharacterized protein n=1 Tax=Spiromyces aspiralis TaxID=68401 RepID=A0ACC1HE29_9FUNG|nr:hypothetical protein EV182_002397 [Spiromyces aspiralis]
MGHAYESLKVYPLPIENALEATQLSGIGRGIAEKLDKKLQEWRRANDIAAPADPGLNRQPDGGYRAASGRLSGVIE